MACSLGQGAKKSVMVFKESVAAQHVRVANRQLRQAEDYIVESADFVAVALAGSTDREPAAPDRRIYKRWLVPNGHQPNKKFRMYACARTTHESPREWASKHCQRVWKAVCSTARQWSLINRLQRRSGQFLPPAACAAACLSATLDARRETFANLETQQTPTQVSEA